jgi:hypothetical protein
MAMILSLKRNWWFGVAGAYIGAVAIRQAAAGSAHGRIAAGQDPNSRPNSNMDYNDFTQMNPI